MPTTAEAGVPGYKLGSWVALYAPAGTPQPVISKSTQEVKQALAHPEVKTRAASQGVELNYMPPEALDSLVKKELNYWGGVIKKAKKANITLD